MKTLDNINVNPNSLPLSNWIIDDCRKSGLSDETIEEMNIEEIPLGKDGRKKLSSILGFCRTDNHYIPQTTMSYAIPYPNQNYSRIKLQNAIGDGRKYLAPSKKHTLNDKPIYFLNNDEKHIKSRKYSLVITEGEKKTAKLSQELRKLKDTKIVPIGIPGVTVQHSIRNFKEMLLADRTVYIVFDSDFRENAAVQHQMVSLYLFLYRKKAYPKVVVFEDEKGSKGIDDYLILAEKKQQQPEEALLKLLQNAQENIFDLIEKTSYEKLAHLVVKNEYRKAQYKALWEKFELKNKYSISFSAFNLLVRDAKKQQRREKENIQLENYASEIDFIDYTENGTQIVIPGLAAAEYVRKQNKNFLYAFESFWRYEKERGIWVLLNDRQIKKEIQEMIGDPLAKKSIIEDVTYQVTHKALADEKFKFDENTWLLNFRNGVLDVKKEEFMSHSREYYQTIQLPFNYDSKAKAPTWQNFLSSLQFEPQTYLRLQEWMGYTLIPTCRLEKCLFFVGEGQNGKNTFLETWGKMLGESTSNIEVTKVFNPFKTAELQGKLVNISGDIRASKALSEEFKDIVSGKQLSAERKYKPSFEFIPVVRFLFSANEFLITKDHSSGFFRRFDVLRFKIQFSEEERDEMLKDKLLAELPGIFNWAFTGLKNLMNNNWKMTHSKEFAETHREFQNYSNPLKRFVDEECKVHESNFVAVKELRERYVTWCKENGHHPLASNKLGMELIRLGFTSTRKKTNDGKTYRGYNGITIS